MPIESCFQVGHAANATVGTLSDMLRDNATDEFFCEWLRSAKPGDEFPDGEGCICLGSPTATECACFPGACRGGQVIDGKLANGQRCKARPYPDPRWVAATLAKGGHGTAGMQVAL